MAPTARGSYCAARGEQWQVEFVPGTDRAVVRDGNATGGPQNLDILGFRPGSDSVFPFAVRPNVLERAPRASPDGRWVAYVSNETGRDEVFVRPFPGGPAVQVSDGGGAEPVWARGRHELFYKGNDDFIAAQFAPGSPFTIVARRKLFSVKRGFFNNPWAARYDVLPGDSTFLMLDPGDDASQADVRTILIQHPAFLSER
jgi:serine/threonine-protein kinase